MEEKKNIPTPTEDKEAKGRDTKDNKETKLQKTAFRPIKKRAPTVVMPKAKYDGAFDKENPYYINIANRYAIMKYVTIFLAFVFAVTMLTAFSSDITAENFQYLLKDLDITGIMSGNTFESVIYSGGSTSSFGIYRGELAVINAGSTMLYKPSGALSFEKTNNFYNPRLLVSDKYFLIYDRGDTTYSYSVYNSFAELHSEKYDYPITLAELSDSGYYAVVTRDDSFRSIVYVYDSSFRLKNEIKKDKYVISVSLNDDGDRLAIASAYDNDGGYESEIMVLSPSSGKPDFTVIENGRIPLMSQWLENGSLYVVFDDSAAVYDKNGEKTAEIALSSLPAHKAAINGSMLVSVYNTTVLGYDKTVHIYDENAELIYTSSFEGELIKILPHGDTVCLLFEDRVVHIDPYSDEIREASVKPNAKDIVFYGDTLIVCYSGGAEPVTLKKQ